MVDKYKMLEQRLTKRKGRKMTKLEDSGKEREKSRVSVGRKVGLVNRQGLILVWRTRLYPICNG